MNRTASVALMVFWPALAGAQTVFFDDFTGPELLPHWSTPPAWHWDYNFNNGMLNVTDLHFPNNPQPQPGHPPRWQDAGGRGESDWLER